MKLLSWILLLPVSLLTVYLALANKHPVIFNLDPFAPETPALAVELPLFLFFLLTLLAGVLLGGGVVWLRGWRKRRRTRTRTVHAKSQETRETVKSAG